jgi:hypothetical protein
MQAVRFSSVVCMIAVLVTAAPVLAQDSPVGSSTLDLMNSRLVALGLNVRVAKAEYVTASTGSRVNAKGNTLICNDRELQLALHWVPNDARRNADGRNITYVVDQSDATPNGGASSTQVEAAIDRAMGTWNAVTCATIPIVKRADSGVDPDLIDGLVPGGFGSVGTPFLADIVHAGWMPPAFFDLFVPGGGNSVLAITLTLILFDPATGSDINNDHLIDVGGREIYYNNYFAWGINANPPVADVETVALHEGGHGLSQGHFGMIFLDQNNNLQFSPFAVMNAVVFGQNHVLQGTDNAGHCGVWASWPTK